jgi:diguanylate cyclase (GGDEF)-like protein
VLHVDILSAYCPCGASAFVAAGLLSLAGSDEPAARRALRLLVAGSLVLAVGLFPVGFAVDDGGPRHPLILLATLGTVGGSVLYGWGIALLSGGDPSRGWAVGAAAILPCIAIAWTQSPALFEAAFNVLGGGVAWVILIAQLRFLGRGTTRAGKALVASLALHAGAWTMRAAYTLASDGSRSFHASHMPAAMVPWLAEFYGVIPLVVAMLTLVILNERLAARLLARARTDDLTGTLSRRALRERAPELLASQQASGMSVAALMLDIDHFKSVNDRHGHAAGDAVLKRTAELVAMNLRSDSVVTRYGGEEFAVLVPVASLEEARAAAERLRKAFEADVVEFEAACIGVTISVGLAMIAPDETLEEALKRADAALYRAKNGGRNRVDVALAAA